jgi:hypothetical protein
MFKRCLRCMVQVFAERMAGNTKPSLNTMPAQMQEATAAALMAQRLNEKSAQLEV